MSPHSIKPLPRLRGRRGGNTQRCGVRSKGRSLLSADNPHSTSTSILDHQLINVFYANSTKWGRKAETFVSKDQSHIICMVEHHLDKLQFVDVARKISAWKRSAFVSYAKRTGLHANATSGGQFILPRSYLSCEAVDQSLLDHCIPAGERDCPRWTACILRTKSVSVLLVVLYLITAEGFSESNAAILQQVFTLVAVFRGVVIIGGDWQFPPSDLIVSPWLARLGLKVVCPAGLDATCSAGSGRLIDYFLATASLVQYIDIKPDVAVDFKPHIGLRLSFPARLRSLSAPALRVPRTLPTLPLADGEHQLDEALWKQAHDYTESYLQRRAAGTRILGCNMAMFRCMSVEDQRLSQEYCFVATRHEVYAALAGGVDSNDLVSYVGRGGFPHASIKPIVKRQTITSRYVCPACDLWGIIESLLQWVKRAAVSGVASMILKLAIVELRRQSARIGDHWTRVAAPNCPPSAWCDWIDGLTVDAVVNGDVAQMPPSYSQVVGVATAVKLPDPGEVQNSTSSPRGGAEFHCYPKPSSGRETDPPAPFAGEKIPDPRGGGVFLSGPGLLERRHRTADGWFPGGPGRRASPTLQPCRAGRGRAEGERGGGVAAAQQKNMVTQIQINISVQRFQFHFLCRQLPCAFCCALSPGHKSFLQPAWSSRTVNAPLSGVVWPPGPQEQSASGRWRPLWLLPAIDREYSFPPASRRKQRPLRRALARRLQPLRWKNAPSSQRNPNGLRSETIRTLRRGLHRTRV